LVQKYPSTVASESIILYYNIIYTKPTRFLFRYLWCRIVWYRYWTYNTLRILDTGSSQILWPSILYVLLYRYNYDTRLRQASFIRIFSRKSLSTLILVHADRSWYRYYIIYQVFSKLFFFQWIMIFENLKCT